MGDYDLPKMLEKVMQVTRQDKLFYVGHSMGTTGFFVMANKHPEMMDHIVLANLLAPVAYVGHMKSPLRYIAGLEDPVEVYTYSAWCLRKAWLLPNKGFFKMFI